MMSLQASGHHLYEPLLGIVLFEMRDEHGAVHCMVSECALRNRALVDGTDDGGVEDLFREYRSEVEAIAAQQYDCGFKDPMVRALDLAPPPPLPNARND
jgi:Protein of unknown function (DUF1488)